MGKRNGFTLVELLITVAIIGIMASMIVFAMFQSQEAAKEAKTRALIARLSNIVAQRYESYRTRRVPIIFTDAERKQPLLMAKMRLDCLRDLMRMEMPERWNDVVDDPATPYEHAMPADKLQRPAVNAAYKRKYDALGTATTEHQYAECLYMIVMDTLAQEGDSRGVFKASDIGDADADGFPEFLDAWRRPIRFLRWPGGYTSPINQLAAGKVDSSNVSGQTGTVTLKASPAFGPSGSPYLGGVMAVLVDGRIDAKRMSRITGYTFAGGVATFSFETKTPVPPPFPDGKPNSNETVVIMAADPFDSRGVYPRPGSQFTETPTFATLPLVFSAGRDGAYGIVCDTSTGLQYAADGMMPIIFDNSNQMMGTEKAIGSDPANAGLDNLTSHDLNRR